MSKNRKPRHGGAVREPSGKLSRASIIAIDAVSPAQARRLRDAAAKGMADAVWASELGRKYLAGELASEHYEAGRRWARLVAAYYRAIGAKMPYPKAQNFERFEPTVAPELTGSELKRELYRVRTIISDMREAYAVLLDAGPAPSRAVRKLCEEDQGPVGADGLRALTRGLSWLSAFWGLTEVRRAV